MAEFGRDSFDIAGHWSGVMGDDEVMRISLPERPAFLDGIGLRQAVLRTWLPIIVIVLIGVASYLPLQSLTVEGESFAET